jgi:hypothetical protein
VADVGSSVAVAVEVDAGDGVGVDAGDGVGVDAGDGVGVDAGDGVGVDAGDGVGVCTGVPVFVLFDGAGVTVGSPGPFVDVAVDVGLAVVFDGLAVVFVVAGDALPSAPPRLLSATLRLPVASSVSTSTP